MNKITKEQIKLVKKLHQKKYRDEYGLFFIEGEKGVAEAMKAGAPIQFVICSNEQVCSEISFPTEKIFYISESDAQKISSVKTWPGIMAVIEKKKTDFTSFQNANLIVALYQMNDPGNLGTIIRTCHWFGVRHILLSEGSVDVYNEKVTRATMGSLFHTDVYQSTQFLKDLQELKKTQFSLVALDTKGKEKEIPQQKKMILLFGSESHGLSDSCIPIADHVIAIAGKEKTVDSLNVAVSVGIVLHSIF